MGRTIIPVFNTGDSFSAAQATIYWRDNEIAHWAIVSTIGMTLIEEFIATGAEADYTFAAIPQIYNHLKLIIMGRSTENLLTSGVHGQFNADVGANYSFNSVIVNNNVFVQAYLGGNTEVLLGVIPALTSTANYPGISEAIIPNYTNATFYKTVQMLSSLMRTADIGGCLTYLYHNVWLDTDPITDIKVYVTAGVFVAETIISLYGML